MTGAAFRLDGALEMATVPGLLKRLPEQLGADLDVSGVSRCDSAGLALLLECRRRSPSELRLQGIPQQLQVLLDFYRLTDLFGPR